MVIVSPFPAFSSHSWLHFSCLSGVVECKYLHYFSLLPCSTLNQHLGSVFHHTLLGCPLSNGLCGVGSFAVHLVCSFELDLAHRLLAEESWHWRILPSGHLHFIVLTRWDILAISTSWWCYKINLRLSVPSAKYLPSPLFLLEGQTQIHLNCSLILVTLLFTSLYYFPKNS